MHSLLVEIAPGLAIQRIVDRALKQEPELEPGILAVERQFGVLELHGHDEAALHRAKEAILDGLGTKAEDQLKPQLLYSDVVEDITDQHAVLINRTRQANMVLPGQSLLLMEVAPALYGAYMGNEAEKAAPELTLVECSMVGASGRLYLAGSVPSLRKAKAHVEQALSSVIGR
ncbi:microcompartment protein [Variovorax sp. LT1P1]|uniref:microcompartment protein n=1 Tax=Variovorax sp. LT1P1 TaxID=3443730 RepID=UPI003F496B31